MPGIVADFAFYLISYTAIQTTFFLGSSYLEKAVPVPVWDEITKHVPYQHHHCLALSKLSLTTYCTIGVVFAIIGGISKRRIRHMAVYSALVVLAIQFYVHIIKNLTVITYNPLEKIISSSDATGFIFIAILSEYFIAMVTKFIVHTLTTRLFNLLFKWNNPGVTVVQKFPKDTLLMAKPSRTRRTH
jgi:hypothetical protein